MRHGKSDWEAGAATDYDRPLARRGRANAARMGAWLRQQGIIPDLTLSSPARRAADTAALAVDAIGCEPARLERSIYLAGHDTLLAVLAGHVHSPSRVMLVGHNPGLEELLVYLCASVPLPPDGKRLPTAATARLQMPQHWDELQPGSAHLLSLTRVRELPPE